MADKPRAKVVRLPVEHRPPAAPAPRPSTPARAPWRSCEMPPGNFRFKRTHWRVGLGYHPYTGVAFVFGDDEANARLIATAPDLLKLALQYGSEWGELAGVGVAPDDQDCKECKFIRDVIAKATGEV